MQAVHPTVSSAPPRLVSTLRTNLPRIPRAEINAWHEAMPVLVSRVRNTLAKDCSLPAWLGSADPEELPRLIEHHGRLWHAGFHTQSVNALIHGLGWSYRTLVQRGFAFDYFLAEFSAWQEALARELGRAATDLVAFFHHLRFLHPELVEAALHHRFDLSPSFLQPADHPILDALLASNESRLRHLLEAQPARRARDDTICRVMRQIGELWSTGTLDVASEHRATVLMGRALDYLRRDQHERLRRLPRRLLVALPPGEQHELAGRLLRDALAEAGHRVDYTGPDLPLHALTPLLEDRPPDVLIVPATLLAHLVGAQRLIARAKAARPDLHVIVGGQAYLADPFLWSATGAHACLHTIPDLLHHVARLP